MAVGITWWVFLSTLCASSMTQLLPGNLFRWNAFNDNVSSIQKPIPPLPPRFEKARMARYVVHMTDWGALATISSQKSISGVPFANLFSFGDGLIGKFSLGIPYFYLTSMDVSTKDLKQNPAATFLVSEATTPYCDKKGLDPESPLCSRVMLSGIIEKVNTTSVSLAKRILFTRHPEMKSWPTSHGWFFGRLKIKQVQLLDFFGGITTIDPKKYFEANLYQNDG